jgi:hypothetical protein
MISSRAIELIEKLIQAPWFQHVEMPLEAESAVHVYSWQQAMELCLSYEWEDICLDASNGLSEILDRDHTDRYQQWNKIVHEVDDRLKSAIESVARRTIAEHGLPEKFEWVLVNTACMACVEAEYSDIVPPAFFMEVASWYLAGHLPCGLTEKYPNGKLMIF